MRRVALAAVLVASGCLSAGDLELPAAPPGTHAAIVVLADGERPATAPAVFAVDATKGLALPEVLAPGTYMFVAYYGRKLAELGLPEGRLDLLPIDDRSAKLPPASALWRARVEPRTAWAPAAAADLDAVRVPALALEACVSDGRCWDRDDELEPPFCNTACPALASIAEPSPPAPITPPVAVSCPLGWALGPTSELGGRGCVFPALEDCAAGAAPFPDDAGCGAVGPCAAGDHGDPTPGRTPIFVAAGARAGGDGSAGAPFATVGEALAHAPLGASLLLGRGTFDVADLTLRDADVELVGLCARETTLAGAIAVEGGAVRLADLALDLRGGRLDLRDGHLDLERAWARGAVHVAGTGTASVTRVLFTDAATSGALDVEGRITASDVVFDHPATGLSVHGAGARAELDGAVVREATALGIEVRDGAVLEGARILTHHSAGPAIACVHGRLVLDVAELRETRLPDTGSAALYAFACGLELSRLVFEETRGTSLGLHAATGTVSDAIVSGQVAFAGDVQPSSLLVDRSPAALRRVLVERYVEIGIYLDHADFRGEDIGVFGCADAGCGTGIELWCSTPRFTRLLVDRARNVGIHSSWNLVEAGPASSAIFEDLIVRGTHSIDQGSSAVGVRRASAMRIERARLETGAAAGIVVADQSTTATITDLVVAGPGPGGLLVHTGATARASRVAVEGASQRAIEVTNDARAAATHLHLSDAAIRGVARAGDAPAVGLQSAGFVRADVSRFSISSVAGWGAFVAQTDTTLADGAIADSEVGLLVQSDIDPVPLLMRVRIDAASVHTLVQRQ